MSQKKKGPTPPSPKNRHRMVAFYLENPEHPKSKEMLKRAVLQNGGR